MKGKKAAQAANRRAYGEVASDLARERDRSAGLERQAAAAAAAAQDRIAELERRVAEGTSPHLEAARARIAELETELEATEKSTEAAVSGFEKLWQALLGIYLERGFTLPDAATAVAGIVPAADGDLAQHMGINSPAHISGADNARTAEHAVNAMTAIGRRQGRGHLVSQGRHQEALEDLRGHLARGRAALTLLHPTPKRGQRAYGG
jgi:hypothetical protein